MTLTLTMIFEFASKVNAGEKGSYGLARFAARGISLHGDEKSMNKLRVNLEQKIGQESE